MQIRNVSQIFNRFFSQKRYPISRKHEVLSSPYELATSTSDFRKIDVDSLKIQFLGVNELFKIKINNIPDYFYIKDYDVEGILKSDTSSLTKEERSLVKYLAKIILNEDVTKGTSESNTDSLVNYKFYVENQSIL